MALIFRNYCIRNNFNLLCGRKRVSKVFIDGQFRYNSDKYNNDLEYISTTILVESGSHMQELPVVVKRLKNINQINEESLHNKPVRSDKTDSGNYLLIQAEFKQCLDLRDVFSLLTKCTKITPNIALGAMERIYDLEKNPSPIQIGSRTFQTSLAKGAILDKLLKVVMKTEDTQTIINILNTSSSFMDPFKYRFSDELLLRVFDNELSIEQLCGFMEFLAKFKFDPKYNESIDKLWVGFIEKESAIDENNISSVFKVLPEMKASKKTILCLLEQKLMEVWPKINVMSMQDILNIFIAEKYFSVESYAVVGRWLNVNIHALNDDSLLDIITKFTRINYTDENIEKAVEKYMKLKASKIETQVLVVGILNYCMQFQLRNRQILSSCSDYFILNNTEIPCNFLKHIIYPFGYLRFDLDDTFWKTTEVLLLEKFEKLNVDDLSSIVLAFLYSGRYPLTLACKLLSPEYVAKVNDDKIFKKLHLIDTALTVECKEYAGPLLPKDHWSTPIKHDRRIANVLDKTRYIFEEIAGGLDKISTGVLIPYVFSDETYFIDVMLHPPGLGSSVYNEKLKSSSRDNIAVLIHLPDHYCSDNKQLIGPQTMRCKHLELLGMKVVSLKYSVISQLYTNTNTTGLKDYLLKCINNVKS